MNYSCQLERLEFSSSSSSPALQQEEQNITFFTKFYFEMWKSFFSFGFWTQERKQFGSENSSLVATQIFSSSRCKEQKLLHLSYKITSSVSHGWNINTWEAQTDFLCDAPQKKRLTSHHLKLKLRLTLRVQRFHIQILSVVWGDSGRKHGYHGDGKDFTVGENVRSHVNKWKI